MYGRGLNSIRWRFTLASAVLTTLGLWGRDTLLAHGTAARWHWPSMFVVVALISFATYLMANRLTQLISALQRSTDAIAAGDFDTPLEVDCDCEVGGLAQSFRRMRSRMNANVMRINALAYTDPITALPNRSVINHLLEYALAPGRQGRFSAALVFIDLDGFKRINDTLGHAAGDELLRLASQRLVERGMQRTLQTLDNCMDAFGNPCDRLPEDIVFARFAGDEFIAILPGVTEHVELGRVAQRVLDALQEPFTVHGQPVSVSASLGMALVPHDTTDAGELLRFADFAMYSAKQAGRSRYRFFDRAVREQLEQTTRIESELRRALEHGELLLHFQPKVTLDTLELAGVEALVRWRHPQRGLLLPASFVEVAEKTGLMVQLGQQVLALAVEQCAQWLAQGIRRPIAINVSPQQFNEPWFVSHLLETLRAARLPRGLLSIEVTESVAMTDFEATSVRLAELRAAGVRVAIDDFGIGFSNLSQLARVPLDELKIDRSLVQDIGTRPASEAIISAIVGMTRSLGCRTIIEGIETRQQLEFVRGLHCDYGQGFLFARPLTPQMLDAWVRLRAAGEEPRTERLRMLAG